MIEIAITVNHQRLALVETKLMIPRRLRLVADAVSKGNRIALLILRTLGISMLDLLRGEIPTLRRLPSKEAKCFIEN